MFIGECTTTYGQDNIENDISVILHNISLEEAILNNITYCHCNVSSDRSYTARYVSNLPYRNNFTFSANLDHNETNNNETDSFCCKTISDYNRDCDLLDNILFNLSDMCALSNLTSEELIRLSELSRSDYFHVVRLLKSSRSYIKFGYGFFRVKSIIDCLANEDLVICTSPNCNDNLFLKISNYKKIAFIFPSELLISGTLEKPHSMPNCMKIEYKPKIHSDAEIIWPLIDNNNSLSSLTNISKVTFWARGEKGGERAEFYFADKSLSTGLVVLNDDWEIYSINLTGINQELVKKGFAYATNRYQNPVGSIIYIDDIKFEL